MPDLKTTARDVRTPLPARSLCVWHLREPTAGVTDLHLCCAWNRRRRVTRWHRSSRRRSSTTAGPLADG